MALPRAFTLKGFTLIEFLVAIAVTAIIFTLGLAVSMDAYKGYNFRSERNLAVSVLQRARSQAMANISQAQHGVHVDSSTNQYVIFSGASFSPSASDNIYVPFISSAVSHTGMSDVVFNQLDGGISSVPSAWHFTDPTHTSDISFNSEGLITWTN